MWLTRISRKSREAQIGAASFAAALMLAVAFILSGLADSFEQPLRDGRDQLRLSPATGEIVIVEIDGRSLEALEQWPWPRGHYATAITELDRLGAEQIAFDVDFSSRSIPAEDERLAQALAEISQPAILATFRQVNQAGEQQTITEALPLKQFRDHAFIASVNVDPADSGRITMYPNGVVTNGTPRPSLANMLAKAGGEVDTAFRVDQAIDIMSIPRISFIDLLDGRVPRAAVAGKQVVIGATAIELFDRYPTALFGVQPGVVIQVQAAETLLQDRARSGTGQWLVLTVVALLLGAHLVQQLRGRGGAIRGAMLAAIMAGVLVVSALALDQFAWTYIALSGPLVFLGAFIVALRFLVGVVNLQAARFTDLASSLPNRTAMQHALKQKNDPMIAAARLADFGEIVTVLGVERIGELDRVVARRLRLLAGVEEIFRLDNGVFAWFMSPEHCDDPEDAFASARALFTAPFDIAGERLRLVSHFGSAEGSIENAEDASELARQRGLGWSANARALHEETQFRQRLLGELDEALESGAISVVFQPKLQLEENAIRSGECLVRWVSPQLGAISPADFIPVLEEKNRIDDLTLFVLREALKRRDEASALGKPLNLSVNVSAQLLADTAFIAATVDLLEATATRSVGGLTLEITESAPMKNSELSRVALERLNAAGARISIDDYGTGQASLNYLQDFPAQEIKLDQSFIRNLMADNKDRIMVQSTIELAHALGFDIVAEGVEDATILATLTDLGCDYAQGWHIGKPTVWSEFVERLGQQPTLGVAA